MRILVSGIAGQLAQSLAERATLHADMELVRLGRPEFDLLEPDTIYQTVERVAPDLVVSAAAYTAVDRAESEPDLAFAVNRDGAGHLAAAAARSGAPVIHVSTDYVFAGDIGRPRVEYDETSPLSVYGRSKLAGEQAVQEANAQSIVMRTSWAHSPYGSNFIRAMLTLATSRPRLKVVADRYGSPTSMLDLADAILHVAGRIDERRFGVYHVANRGVTSWADFARYALAASRAVGGPWVEVDDIGAIDYPQPAQRPINSELNCDLFERNFHWAMPSWQEGTTMVAQRIALEMIRPETGQSRLRV